MHTSCSLGALPQHRPPPHLPTSYILQVSTMLFSSSPPPMVQRQCSMRSPSFPTCAPSSAYASPRSICTCARAHAMCMHAYMSSADMHVFLCLRKPKTHAHRCMRVRESISSKVCMPSFLLHVHFYLLQPASYFLPPTSHFLPPTSCFLPQVNDMEGLHGIFQPALLAVEARGKQVYLA